MWRNDFTSSSKKGPISITVRNLDEEHKPSSNLNNTTTQHSSPLTTSSTLSRTSTTQSSLSMGWLLRLFRSEFFDAWMAVTYLYRYRESRGVHDYLCNELYHLSDVDLEIYLPQVCNLLVYHTKDSVALERFVMDKCADSIHFALQVYWFLQAAVEDSIKLNDRKSESKCRLLRTRCETAAVNGSFHRGLSSARQETRLLEAELSYAPRTLMTVTKQPRRTNTSSSTESSSSSPSSNSAGRLPPRNPSGKQNTGADRGGKVKEDDTQGVEQEQNHTTESDGKKENKSTPSASASVGSHRRSVSVPPQIEVFDACLNIKPEGVKDVVEQGGHRKQKSVETLTIAIDQLAIHNDTNNTTVEQARKGEQLEEEEDDAKSGESRTIQPSTSSADAGARKDVQSTFGQENPKFQSESPPRYETHHARAVSDTGYAGFQREESLNSLEFDHSLLLSMKQERFDYFNDALAVMRAFVGLSLALRDVPQEKRRDKVRSGLSDINERLLRRMMGEPFEDSPKNVKPLSLSPEEIAEMGQEAALRSVHLTLSRAMSPALRILRISAQDTVLLTSRTRAPYMLYLEVLHTSMLCSDPLIFCQGILHTMEQNGTSVKRPHPKEKTPPPSLLNDPSTLKHSTDIADAVPPATLTGKEKTPMERLRDTVRSAIYGDAKPSAFSENKFELDDDEPIDETTKKARHAALLAVYGELWSWKEERILSESLFHLLPGRKLASFIVKAGDDLRQEQLAVQLISQFQWIFDEENVNVYLRPFTVVCVSSDSGLIEVIPDAVSIHSLKKRTPNFISLLDYFIRAYGPVESKSFKAAQKNFIKSMAGYSLVTYFLQIKDRHNGNIMLDAEGHIIHIDFGFMLANSPGSIKFENVPFKLTEEYLQVICGMDNVHVNSIKANKSEGWLYYRELIVLGFLAARKHHEKLTTLVEIMMEGTMMPCMTGGRHVVVDSLRQRFNLGVPEQVCISNVLGLIEESRNSWRSLSYDKFQFYTNGYL